MTLEEQLRDACAKGITHLTLYPVPSVDNKTLYWCARATPSTGHSYVQTQTLDPVEAVTEVLKALPAAKRLRQPNPEPNLRGSGEVTATVKPEEPPQPETLEKWLPKT